MNNIINYTLSNFAKEILLEEIASVANLTPNSFCRYFKRETGKTYLEFLIDVRLKNAIKLMRIEENFSILDIAELSGFRNMSNFHRQFKKSKGCTPFQYQKEINSTNEHKVNLRKKAQ